jgi:hypothetical protein
MLPHGDETSVKSFIIIKTKFSYYVYTALTDKVNQSAEFNKQNANGIVISFKI